MSIGLGRYEPLSFDDDGEKDPKSLSIGDKFSKLVWSATDTETVHSTLQDLLPSSVYFRFNPYLSGEICKMLFSLSFSPLNNWHCFVQKCTPWMRSVRKSDFRWCRTPNVIAVRTKADSPKRQINSQPKPPVPRAYRENSNS